ncbi:hypothetical protein KIPB_007968, partial [Kipferlia bialata]|eukprot:g7968.t1
MAPLSPRAKKKPSAKPKAPVQ